MSKGQLAAVIGSVATVLTAFGLSDVASIIQNPLVGYGLTALVGVISSAVAGHLPGKKA